MRDITKLMIHDFNLKKLGIDFMGYEFNLTKQLSFHHLVIPRKDCQKKGYGSGYLYWNGAILRQSTSHDYLHIIQRIDPQIFKEITREMIEENQKGYLDKDNLERIKYILKYFEREHCSDRNKNGYHIIKEEYVRTRRI